MSDLKQMSQKLVDELGALQGKKIVIFGDIGIDEYVRGEVARISPEAPVPVVEVNDTDKKLGLSANVAANIKSLGGIPQLFSLIGKDSAGETLKELLNTQGISPEFLITDPERATTTKLRVMAGHHHVVRVDFENKAPMKTDLLNSHQELLKQTIQESDCVIIQDYAKGQISKDSAQMVIQMAKEAGKKVIVDPYRSTPLSFYDGADFMTPNRDEAFELAKQIPKPEIWKNVDLIGKELMEHLHAPNMVITLGPEGMKIFNQQDSLQLPTFARKVFDVTGAGDTVIAAFALGVAAGWDMEKAGLLANLAAGVVVGQVGAVACTTEQIQKSVESL